MTDKPQQPEDQKPSSETDASAEEAAAEEQAAADQGPDTAEEPADAEPGHASGAPSETSSGVQAEAEAEATAAAIKPETKKPETKRPKQKKTGGWGAFFLFLILLGGIGGLAYYQWLQQQEVAERMAQLQAELNAELEEQESQVAELSQSLRGVQQESEQTLREALQETARTAEQGQQEVRQLEQQLEQQSRRLDQQLRALRQQVRAISTTTTEDWKLAEAYYLTRLAGQRLLMERDPGSARALLEAADSIVKDHPDPDLYPVRSALADDIAALRLANEVDRSGLYLQIAALAGQIADLQIAEPLNFEPEGEGGEPGWQAGADGEGGVWESIRQSFANAMEKLQDFVRVTRHDDPPEPLIAPDQQLYLRSSLQTALDTAQLALMREQPAIYESSLEKAQRLLSDLYTETEQRNEILAELNRLENTDIQQDLPDITESQEALGDYLEERHQLAPEGGSSPQQEDEQEAQQ